MKNFSIVNFSQPIPLLDDNTNILNYTKYSSDNAYVFKQTKISENSKVKYGHNNILLVYICSDIEDIKDAKPLLIAHKNTDMQILFVTYEQFFTNLNYYINLKHGELAHKPELVIHIFVKHD